MLFRSGLNRSKAEARFRVARGSSRSGYRHRLADNRLPQIIQHYDEQQLPESSKANGRKRLELLRARAIMHTLYASGGRVSEIASLTRGQVADGNASEVLITGKGSKERMLFLTPEAQSAIKIYCRERGHVEVVDELLTHTHVDVNHVNNLGWTALLEAIVLSDGGARHQRVVQLLIDHGADIHIADKDGVTPMQHAQTRGYKEIAGILRVAEGRSRPATQQDLALIAAAGNGDAQAVKQLLSQGANVHASDGAGVTALIAAAYGDHVSIGELLIAAGADVNVQDNTKQSAYLIPTADGSLAFLKLTLRSGADVHRTDSYNGTGLIRAADRGHVDVIAELLKTDIKVNHVNNLGWTALLEAIILGDGGLRHTEAVRLLITHGADVNLADSEGVTPLAHARQRGFADIMALIEKSGGR